ncbi:MAG: penicillin-binding protein, partial [Betaproteobacteria bacterium]|nr:penicillin-binding protein [Betaproteobacteria bacterium]
MATTPTPKGSQEHAAAPAAPRSLAGQLLLWAFGIATAGMLIVGLLVGVALAMIYPQLPDVSDLSDYRPKLSMRVYSVEGTQIGEFGEERRNLTAFKDIPKVMKDAVLAIEDARFYQHGGVDYIGLMRASLANLGRAKSQGASTITMQVARNVYLSSEKTFTRKIYEILLTTKLEHTLSKDQIFEIYLNQIYLGNRAYGFAAASEAYFGKPLKNISIAEAAMLAGLPKAPSAYNPISNPKRARSRQLYIIER